MSDERQNEHNTLVAWLIGGAVVLAIAVSMIASTIGINASGKKEEPAPAPAAAAAPASGEVDQAPAVATGPGYPEAISFFFETGKADLPADAAQQLAAIVEYAKGKPEAKLGVSGFHDKQGDAALNAELAKNRAKATRDALVAAGVAESQIVLVKPQETTGGADGRAARRVDVYPAQ